MHALNGMTWQYRYHINHKYYVSKNCAGSDGLASSVFGEDIAYVVLFRAAFVKQAGVSS